MKPRHLWIVLFCFLVPAAGLALPEPEPTFCSYVCQGASCDEYCRLLGGGTTTCGQYYGAPANDLDRDGVANSSDNCLCAANANQADCDTDGLGNVCDPRNEKWVLEANLGVCDFDTDAHSYYWGVELYSSSRYRNVCDGSICYDRYVSASDRCTYSPSGCGSGAIQCCDCKFPGLCYPGTCGSPACPF